MKTVDKNSERVISDPQSPYDEFYKKYNAFNDKSRTVEALPEEVTHVIQKAVGSVKPKARYMASVPVFNRLMAHCPDAVKDRVIRALFKV